MELSEGLNAQHSKIGQQRQANETWQRRNEERDWPKEREDRKRYFEVNFKYGSTTVLKHNVQYFFRGDIRHCGCENIFHNARKIKSVMQANGQTLGHMNYNDLPTFSSKWDWEREERVRKQICQDDLYKFVGDEIVVGELIGAEPIGHIYKNEPSDPVHPAEPAAKRGGAIDTPARW